MEALILIILFLVVITATYIHYKPSFDFIDQGKEHFKLLLWYNCIDGKNIVRKYKILIDK